MKLVTPSQMKEIDRYAIEELGIPSIVLMENAALRVVEVIADTLGGNVNGHKILVLAGKGNNGGDAFAAARHLFLKGAEVFVYLLAERSGISEDAGINLKILDKLNLETVELINNEAIHSFNSNLANSEIIIDGIFGTGLKGKPNGIAEAIIRQVNMASKKVISIDIPSGVNGETGEVPGLCIKADKTVTFQLPKIGLILHPGCEYIGKLIIADIGIPDTAINRLDIMEYIIDKALMKSLVPIRKTDSNKGSYGKIFIITGSTGMTGSGCLCARSALRCGAGLCYVGVPSSLSHIYAASLIEPIILPLRDSGDGTLSLESVPAINDYISKMSVLAVGPGLSVNESTVAVVRYIIRECNIPLILDADALNCISTDVSILKELKTDALITPHPGEMARLTGLSIDEIQKDRLGAAKDFALRWKVTVVLKGSRTVIAFPDGRYSINLSGNPGMAAGGTGDVLTGIIAGLAGQGMKLSDAAVLGVYIHGAAGDSAAGNKGMHGMIAGDIIEELPYIIKDLYES